MKQKTHSGAKKRIKITGSGKLKRRRAFSSHLKRKKDVTRKRKYARDYDISKADIKRLKKLIPGI